MSSSSSSSGKDLPSGKQVLEPGLYYMHWVDVGKLVCRPVKLDSKQRVVYSMPSLVPSVVLSTYSYDVIHTAVGTAMLKVKGNDRPSVSQSILRLFDMVDASLRAALYDLDIGLDFCSACGGSTECASNGRISQCSFCLCAWHASCELSLCSNENAQPAAITAHITHSLPACMSTSYKCRLCTQRLSQSITASSSSSA